ncbi:type II toxin-antitoxin system VapC family toxin [Candidatus Palauibacter sp.]|uniref:type II toxin-antitoxin system VapC family toxin n=1 Tax=Candidatus Palauibacter sp. TaxID=3101350 RepID=UPI003B51F303
MKLLADTHTLLWAIASPEKLGKRAREMLVSTENHVAFSTVSLWEIAIKVSLGRLELDPDWRNAIESGRKHLRARWLLLAPQRIGRGLNHGRRSSNYIQDCTICVSALQLRRL